MRRLYRLNVLRLHLHGGDGEKLWTPMHDLLAMMQQYPLMAWHPRLFDLGPVVRDPPLTVELVLSAVPPREHDWTEMMARAVGIYQTMRPESDADGPPDWSTLVDAAVLAPGDEASLCPMVNANTVTLARTLVEHQNIVHDRVQALQRRHAYIYGPSPRVIVATLAVVGGAGEDTDPLDDDDDVEDLRLDEGHPLDDNDEAELEEEGHASSSSSSYPSSLPPLASPSLDGSPPPPSPRSDSSTPETNHLGEAVAFCYPGLDEFTHWHMMYEVQQLMERFKVHLNNNCAQAASQLERPLVVCQGVCPVVAATSIPEHNDLTPTILPVVDFVLLNHLRQELRTDPCGYQLAVFQTQSPVDPPSFLCHCRPPPPPP
ncbi:MAG: hypothetical protein L7S63_08790 [Flavobacteriales bacterium]|nr:hypothetical protein [Flavobacteriales bacterium]